MHAGKWRPIQYNAQHLLYAVDLAGTFVFAVEGASRALTGHLDFFGLTVLAFATAVGGGIIRDLLIGAVPPSALRDWRYAAVAFAGALTVFFFHQLTQDIPHGIVLILDAAGLSLFAVSGTGTALEYKMHPFIAVLLGTITGVGGGTIRDLFLAQVPTVLRSDIYATAALAGAVVMVLALELRLPRLLSTCAGGVACFALRMVSVWQHWNLPTVGS